MTTRDAVKIETEAAGTSWTELHRKGTNRQIRMHIDWQEAGFGSRQVYRFTSTNDCRYQASQHYVSTFAAKMLPHDIHPRASTQRRHRRLRGHIPAWWLSTRMGQ
ncbi:MAG TPA: hypothetical protein VGM32_08405, partial [Rhodopila sp.]